MRHFISSTAVLTGLLVPLLLHCSSPSDAAAQDTHNWNDPTGGVWGTFTKWTPIGLPSAFDTARFDLATTDPVPISLIESRSIAELLVSDGEIAFHGSGIFAGDRTLTTQNSRIQHAGHLILEQADAPGTTREFNLDVVNQLDVFGRPVGPRRGLADQ